MGDFDIVKELLGFTLIGAEWVLWLLLFSSVISIAVMLERIYFFYSTRLPVDFPDRLARLLVANKIKEAKGLCEENPHFEGQVALEGLRLIDRDPHIAETTMEGTIVSHRYQLDRGLVILGTLGNNAPFIGLFGTVIGIIKAFHDLSLNPDGGPSVVMSGISEALVATAVGLLVAIPAVIAFNGLNRVVKRRIANAQAIQKLVVSNME